MIRPEEDQGLNVEIAKMVNAGVLAPLAQQAIMQAYYIGYKGAMADVAMGAAAFVQKKATELRNRPPAPPIIRADKVPKPS